jgi:hypothetical protein
MDDEKDDKDRAVEQALSVKSSTSSSSQTADGLAVKVIRQNMGSRRPEPFTV